MDLRTPRVVDDFYRVNAFQRIVDHADRHLLSLRIECVPDELAHAAEATGRVRQLLEVIGFDLNSDLGHREPMFAHAPHSAASRERGWPAATRSRITRGAPRGHAM